MVCKVLTKKNGAVRRINLDHKEALSSERTVFRDTVRWYKEYMQEATKRVEAAELEAEQSREQFTRLKRSAKEWRASSFSVNARVRELKEAQGALIRLMDDVSSRMDKRMVNQNIDDLDKNTVPSFGKNCQPAQEETARGEWQC